MDPVPEGSNFSQLLSSFTGTFLKAAHIWAGTVASQLMSLFYFWHCYARGMAQRRWLTGVRVRPILNFWLSVSLLGGLKVNFCMREVKKMNSSVLANCSPRHARFPERQKQKSYLVRWCWCLTGIGVLTLTLEKLDQRNSLQSIWAWRFSSLFACGNHLGSAEHRMSKFRFTQSMCLWADRWGTVNIIGQ